MKRVIRVLFCCFTIFGCTKEQPVQSSFIFDYESILTVEQKGKLNELINKHEQKTTNEIAVVTTPDWGDQENALLFSVNFGNIHGVGKKEKDNGVVIVFSKQMRETRISTGYGTEKVMRDEVVKEIIDSIMIPQFRDEKYFEGIFNGTKAVVDFLERPENEIK